jgi:alpha-tubulin suppressor-like RCC1 family protein
MISASAHRILAAPLLAGSLSCADVPTPTDPGSRPLETASQAATPLAFRQIAAGTGSMHTCGVTTDNRLFCWGDNSNGQLGDGTTTRRLRPAPVAGSRTYHQVSTGYDFTCAVSTTDRAFCWGANTGHDGGQLGDGTIVSRRLRPVAVLGGHAFRQVTTGLYHACGVTMDDRAWCWGSNRRGELGNGMTSPGREPVAVAGSLRFRQVSAGWNHTCGVTVDDRAYCWGLNTDGQLGDSTQTMAIQPVPVAGGRRFRQVDGGGFHTCAVTPDNRAYCWGWNLFGQIGDSRTTPRRLWPVRAVTGGLSFRRVEAAGNGSCGVTTGDVAYCWGQNQEGGLGDGTTINRFAPVPVAGGHAFAQGTTGLLYSCGRTTALRAYCWGYNGTGALGDGTTMNRLHPVAVAPPAP